MWGSGGFPGEVLRVFGGFLYSVPLRNLVGLAGWWSLLRFRGGAGWLLLRKPVGLDGVVFDNFKETFRWLTR